MSYFVLVGGSMFAEKGVFGVVQRDNSETERDCRGGGGSAKWLEEQAWSWVGTNEDGLDVDKLYI